MYVRCPSCMGSTRFGPTRLDGQPSCDACGHGYSFERLGQLGSTPLERFVRAEEFARSNGIDLASAYAVLLGILPIERALAVGEGDAPPGQPASQQAPIAGGPRLQDERYDPGFADAVATGKLTVWGAIQRGDRVLYASRVSQKHDLPLDLSFLVTDNQMSLVEAKDIALSRRSGRQAGSSRPVSSLARLALVLGIAALAGGAIWHLHASDPLRERPDGAPNSRRKQSAVMMDGHVRADPSGQVVSVTAANPEAVLGLFCRSTRAIGLREPVRIVSLGGNDSLGVFSEAGMYYAIRIRTELRGRVAFAGDDRQPLVPEPAPAR